MTKKWVYLFGEVAMAEEAAGSWEGVRSLLGGKGAGLADMARSGVPVPPGFTVTTEACNEYSASGKFPDGLWQQELDALIPIQESRQMAGKLPGIEYLELEGVGHMPMLEAPEHTAHAINRLLQFSRNSTN